MKKQAIFIFVILTLLLSACATNKAATQSPLPLVAPGARDTSGAGEQGVAPSAPSKGGDTYNSTTTSTDITVAQQRLIQTDVTLSIVVPDVQKKMDEINQMVAAMGGYLVSMNINQIDYGSGNKYPQGTISIRREPHRPGCDLPICRPAESVVQPSAGRKRPPGHHG